ncbi:MAG: hypothetical protein ACOX1V_03870 [Candidatus Iainarchaeum sp.]|jgi:hypothetical protein
MVKIIDKKVALSSEELKLLGEGKEYELIPNQKGVFLLIEKQELAKKEGKEVCVSVPHHEDLINLLEEEKQQVIGLIKKEKLSELVEGRLEERLNEKQKKALSELLKEGVVFVFKLNESYKKGVYKLREETKNSGVKESKNFNAIEKNSEDYNLEQDGFLVAKNLGKARALSCEYEGQIKEGMLKGISTFDKNYYLIETDLLEEGIIKILNAFKEKKPLTLEEIAKSINYSKTLTKIICEFLKEEGELIEKRKEQYSHIN